MKSKLFYFFLLLAVGTTAHSQQVFKQEYKERLDGQYASPLFRDKNAYMFTPADDPAALGNQTIFQYLQGRVPGLIINNNNIFSPSASWRMNRTAYFLNEMRVDAAAIALLNINDIGLVKVFRPPFVGAIGNGPGGAIAVYTLRADDEEDL